MQGVTVDIRKTTKINKFGHKEWLEICAIFFIWSRGNDENSSCFIVSLYVNDYLHSLGEASE